EVKDVEVIVERAFDLHGRAVVVAVQPFALVALVADEVPGAENQVVLGDPDLEAFSHDHSACQGTEIGTFRIPLRRAANKAAVPRAAVVPGFRQLPSARSQPSRSASSAGLSAACGQPADSTAWARRLASAASVVPHFRAIRLSGQFARNCR